MPSPTIYDTVGSATADGSGNATVTIAGPRIGQRWQLVRITVSIPSMATTALVAARVYRNAATGGNLISSTRTGAMDTDSDPRASLAPGEQLLVVFNGASAGAACNVNLAYEVG